jgi:hypothetical protein
MQIEKLAYKLYLIMGQEPLGLGNQLDSEEAQSQDLAVDISDNNMVADTINK